MRSAEIRGLSAIDVALWDIAGQALDLPLYRLLGGPTRQSLRVYNTCAGYRYGGRKPTGSTANYTDGRSEGPYEDLDAFLNRADELAEDLLSEGYRAMKIWPFDQFGPATNGQQISAEEIARGCEPFEKIRRAVGNRIEIALEMHSVWGLPAAQRIARAVEAYDPLWFEDPVRMDNLDALLQFRQSTRIPTTASETMSTRWQFREAFEKGALSVVMFDIGWVGGLSEARKIANMAEAYQLPDRAARLRRPDHADSGGPPGLRRPERLHPGGGAGVPPRRLPRPRHGAAGGRRRRDPPARRRRDLAPACCQTCARGRTRRSGSPRE